MSDLFFSVVPQEADPPPTTVTYLPTLAFALGANNGNALLTAAAAGTLALLFETSANTASLPLMSGWTNLVNLIGSSDPDVVTVSSRVSRKFLSANETIPANAGSRRIALLFTNVDPVNPVHRAAGLLGRSTTLRVPGLSLEGPRVIVSFTRREGTTTPALQAPLVLRQTQGTSAIALAGSTAAPQFPWAGQILTTGGEDWNAASIALNPLIVEI